MKTNNNQPIRILAAHLLNDFSGSPLVFANILKKLSSDGHNVELITNQSKGFLSDIPSMKYDPIPYTWSPKRLITLARFFIFQFALFFKVLEKSNSIDVVYLNTMLPAFAAIAAKIRRKKVVVHLHETSVKPRSLKWLLKAIIIRFSDKLIFVSEFLAEQEHFGAVERKVIPNSLSEEFLSRVTIKSGPQLQRPRILMLCSLKKYKGVDIFVDLAEKLPYYTFDLVLNASQEQIDKYFDESKRSSNLNIYPVQTDVHPFYEKASLVCNLSLPDQWVETFGMTALEAMAYGKPVIVPPVGGIAEVVRNGLDGYHVDSRDLQQVVSKIRMIFSNLDTYLNISRNALNQSKEYRFEKQYDSVLEVLRSNQKIGLTLQEA